MILRKAKVVDETHLELSDPIRGIRREKWSFQPLTPLIRIGRGREMKAQVDLPEKKIATFCREHGIRRLAVFGSVLRTDFGPDNTTAARIEVTVENDAADVSFTLTGYKAKY